MNPGNSPKGTFVIVHGAWTGAWSWERVTSRLHARGHRAYAPTLTGNCERSHLASPAVNLETHIDDIVNEILWKDLTEVVLVAHSYGGFVAAGVTERIPDRISSIVFLEAFIPDDGTSFADLVPGWRPTEPMVAAPPSSPGDYLSEEDRVWVDSKATAQCVATFTQKLKVTGAYQRVGRKTFIVATGQGGISGETARRFRDDPGWVIQEIPCGHDAPIDMPEELTAMLEGSIPR
jgi:pimeloyl-ACP methyl ester carboxylesterase